MAIVEPWFNKCFLAVTHHIGVPTVAYESIPMYV